MVVAIGAPTAYNRLMACRPERRGNRWRVVVDIGRDPITRKRRRRSITGHTRAEVLDRVAELRLESRRRAPTTKGRSCGELLEAWWAIAAPELAPQTRPSYRRYLDQYLIPAFGNVLLHKLDTEAIDRLYARLRTRGTAGRPLAASTIRKIHAPLNAALAQGVRWKHLRDNPAERATLPPLPKRSKRRRPYIPPDQIRKVLERCDLNLVDAAMLSLATSGRAGELCGLRWSDLELLDIDGAMVPTVTIAQAIGEVDHELLVLDDDDRKSERRTVAVDAGTWTMLKRRRAAAAELALAFGAPLDPGGYVLSEVPGGAVPLAPQKLSDRWRWRSDRAGVKVRFHDLRHFHVSHLLDGNVPIPEVVRQAGWTSPQMISVYGHTVRAVDRRGSVVLGPILDGLRSGTTAE